MVDPATASEVQTSYNLGMQGFAKGDWDTAITNLEKVPDLLTNYPAEQAKLGPLYYALGAACFNLPNYPKAIEAFKTYITKFPQAEKVNDAKLAIARATYADKQYEEAAKLFEVLAQYPSLREQSLAIQAQCYKELGMLDKQTAVLEKLSAGELKSTIQGGAAASLAGLYLETRDMGKLKPLLAKLVAARQFVENMVGLNSLIVRLGDAEAEEGKFEEAAHTYLGVLPPAQVVAFQKQRIAFLEDRMAANTLAARKNAQAAVSLLGQNAEFQPVLDQARALLDEFEKLPDYMPAISLRVGRCWYEREKKWECILVFRRLMEHYPDASKEREAALFGSIIAYADLNQTKRCHEMCEQYLKDFPTGPNAGTVGFVHGSLALQTGDAKGAAVIFGRLIEKQPQSQFAERMHLLLGNSYFTTGELTLARSVYLKCLAKYPKGPTSEEAAYRAALVLVFVGKYEEGWKELEKFINAHPKSDFTPDAQYRLMVCKYAASLYDEVIKDGVAWRKAHPGDPMEAEVLSLTGDCLAAQGKTVEASVAYGMSFERARNDDVLNYAMGEAAKACQKLGQWAELSAMMEKFIKAKPDHPSVIMAMYWVGKSKGREGKTDEAKALMLGQLTTCINNAKNESVELLLQQMAQLCWKRPRAPPAPLPTKASSKPAASGSAAKDAASAPAPVRTPVPAPLPPWDAVADLDQQLAHLDGIAKGTGQARVIYAKYELLKLLRRDKDAEDAMREIAAGYEPSQLSPQLLALCGDFHHAKGEDAEATKFYNYLRENFLKNSSMDHALVGLADMAMKKGQAQAALVLYNQATDEFAGAKIKEATLGKATALLELKKFAEAKKLFEQVAGMREWRGEATAQAVYSLGEVERRQGRYPEAIAHYQRVFVAYQKFLPWVAKAYVRAADSFEQLGKRKEAVMHLQEMQRNSKLDIYPEWTEAEKMLARWGGSS